MRTDVVHVPAGRGAGLRLEGTGEVTGRQTGAGGERLHAQVRARVLSDPLLELAQRRPPSGPDGRLRAELGLVARPAQEHDQVPRDGQRGVPAQVLLHQGEVDAGGHARGRGHPPVADVDRVGVDRHGRVVAREPVAVGPGGGGAAAVQKAGQGEQDRAGADGDQPPGAWPVLAHPVGQPRVRVPGAPAAGHDQGVRLGRVGEDLVRYDGQTAGRTGGRPVPGGRADTVRPRYAPGTCRSAPTKTSTGPATSRLWTWSQRTRRTVRCAMSTILRPPGDDSTDEHPASPAMRPGGRTDRLVTCAA